MSSPVSSTTPNKATGTHHRVLELLRLDANIVVTMLAHGERRLLTFNAADVRRYGDRIQLAVS